MEYTYDPSGRRTAKTFDGVLTNKYVYDGDSIIAEYDGSDTLVRKYIQGEFWGRHTEFRRAVLSIGTDLIFDVVTP